MTRFTKLDVKVFRASALSLTLAVFCVSAQSAQAQPKKAPGADAAAVNQVVSKAVAFLQQAQGDDGSFQGGDEPGVSTICIAALLKSGRSASDPVVARGLKFLEGKVHEDGGIYKDGSTHKNYETCMAIVAFQAANKDGRYKDLIARAEEFVKKEQWDQGEEQDPSKPNFGGAGYGSRSRPDLSNTSFLVDALHAIGRGEDDPAMQKALIFISRCQNLESKHNTMPTAAKVNDGGFYYTIAGEGQSMAGQTPEGGLRSYGSMTYAGLKSMIYAGLKKDDVRVKAAYDWIKKNYTVTENPGMAQAGFYYYLHTFAKTMSAVGEDRITSADGTVHDWRAEVIKQLASTQKPDGSWVNGTTRWLEGDPKLVTAYCLMALSYCQPADAGKVPADRVLPSVPVPVIRQ